MKLIIFLIELHLYSCVNPWVNTGISEIKFVPNLSIDYVVFTYLNTWLLEGEGELCNVRVAAVSFSGL